MLLKKQINLIAKLKKNNKTYDEIEIKENKN